MDKLLQLKTDGLGLIVPMNIEALCAGNQTEARFKPSPYNFDHLPDQANPGQYLSDQIMTGGLRNMEMGVHLHWALPDGLTRGVSVQDTTGNMQFPSVPDRWLITRVYTNLTDPKKPTNRVKSWVVESNYLSPEMPDPSRPSVAVPLKSDDGKIQQYRYMGRVTEFEVWKQNFLTANVSDSDAFAPGLSAVGYGSPEFSASYQDCRSLFGFYDKADELNQLSKIGDNILLSYQVVGWHHDIIGDPIVQLPLQMDEEQFEALYLKISDPADKDFFSGCYRVMQAGGLFVLDPNLDSESKIRLWFIMDAAGFDFLAAVLERNKWSLPSGTLDTPVSVTHTLLTGQLVKVIWNQSANATNSLAAPNSTINIAVGNTAAEALAALIAGMTDNQDLPNVEFLLNALQLGKLNGIKNPEMLNRIEDLQLAIHAATFQSDSGGNIWQVSTRVEEDKGSDEIILPEELAQKLNDLNIKQVNYDEQGAEIKTLQSQIFMDWYRYMQVLHPDKNDPDRGMKVADMAKMITKEITDLNLRISANNTSEIDRLAAEIRAALPENYELEQVSGPRIYQPLEPVVLFQGQDINPPARYGGDGRYMADDTLLCRLSDQIITQVIVPSVLFGGSGDKTYNASNTPHMSESIPLDYGDQIHALFTEWNLLNPSVLAALLIQDGSTMVFDQLQDKLAENITGYVEPPIRIEIKTSDVEAMQAILYPFDFDFFTSLYDADGEFYRLRIEPEDLTKEDKLRLDYLFVSTQQKWGTKLNYSGIAPSPVYFVTWYGNPWLPYSLSWEVNYYPFEPISYPNNYNSDFILNKFKLGDVTLEPKVPVTVPIASQSYKNFIFLTPHAEENFREQIENFIDGDDSPVIDEELQEILDHMKNFPPVLSQALNGLNAAMLMRNEVLQLEVKDPSVTGPYATFSNSTVRNAVSVMNETSPAPSNYYNPIRAGVVSISYLTIVDVFGRNIQISKPSKVLYSQSLQTPGLPVNYGFFAPRLVQSSRLFFRWLSAGNNMVEMNSHPATTPICGWLMANNLDYSLWIYENTGKPVGSIILTEDSVRVIWQSVPGGLGFGMPIEQYFATGPGKDVNEQLKELVLSLYNGGDGSYLKAFMRANDVTFSTVQPQNYKQLGSTAVLMGAPIAVAQARLDLELLGLPAYNQSWEAMKNEVNSGSPKTDGKYSEVKFPVRLGAMEQVDDGLLGYFKAGDYSKYYALNTDQPSEKVVEPTDSTIVLTSEPKGKSQLVTLLFDPSGSIHATTGVLPVKDISIPPDLYSDALNQLEMAFLTTPILTNVSQLAFPTPNEGGGHWTWVENDLNQWSEATEIKAIDDQANLVDTPQEIKEGWMKLNPNKN